MMYFSTLTTSILAFLLFFLLGKLFNVLNNIRTILLMCHHWIKTELLIM